MEKKWKIKSWSPYLEQYVLNLLLENVDKLLLKISVSTQNCNQCMWQF